MSTPGSLGAPSNVLGANGLSKVIVTLADNCIEIKDFGTGIHPADLPHIFERLYRVDASRTLETGRTGLGLSIAKRIIDLHEGRIIVESVVAEGSVFRVFLPRETWDGIAALRAPCVE